MSESRDVRGRDAAMVPLEQRYRRLLRLLPASYRAVWEEEMVATFLDSVDVDDPEDAEYQAYCGRPSRAEVSSLVALAVRLRLGGVEAPPRSFVWGEAVRRVALVGLLVYAVGGTVMMAQDLWISWANAGPLVPEDVMAIADPRSPQALDLAWTLAWVGAYLALVLGRRRTAKVLAGVGLGLSTGGMLHATVTMPEGYALLSPGMITRWAELLLMVAVVLALAAFHRDAPAVRPGPWLAAYAAGLALFGALVAVFSLLQALPVETLDSHGVWSVALIIVGLVHLYGPPLRAGRTPAWPLALALLAASVLGLRLLALVDHAWAGTVPWGDAWLAASLTQTVVLAAVGAVLAIRASQILRDRPCVPPGPPVAGRHAS